MSYSEEMLQLIASNGDVRLAAERSGLSVHQLSASLIADPQTLQDAIRSSMSLQLLDVLANVRISLIASLGEMSPKEMINLLEHLLSGFKDLWSDGVVNNNLIAFPAVNNASNPIRDKLESRISQLVASAEGN